MPLQVETVLIHLNQTCRQKTTTYSNTDTAAVQCPTLLDESPTTTARCLRRISLTSRTKILMAECLYVADTAHSKRTPRYIAVAEVAVLRNRDLYINRDTTVLREKTQGLSFRMKVLQKEAGPPQTRILFQRDDRSDIDFGVPEEWQGEIRT
jgi:hypothetical protein